MAEIRDSSGLFSLERLFDLERERVAAEERQRREEEIRSRVERDRLERETERLRAIELERRRGREEMMAREAEARLAAIRQVEATRGLVEVQARSRIEILEQEQNHERRMAQLRDEARRRRDRMLVGASLGACALTLAVALGLYFGRLRPEQVRAEASHRALVRMAEEQADYAERIAADAKRHNAVLAAEVDRLKRALEAAGSPAPQPKAPRAGSGSLPRLAPAKPCPKDGDPLNPCLG
jgi:hypothetical protein